MLGEAMVADPAPSWHALQIDEVLRRLETTRRGLSDDEIAGRLARYGPNRLETQPGVSALRKFVGQLANILIYILFGSAVVTGILGEWTETGVILGVVVLNALIGVIQEGRAEKALAAIRGLLAPTAVVERGGQRRELLASELLPGDLVLLRAGDRVPADLRLLTAHGQQYEKLSSAT